MAEEIPIDFSDQDDPNLVLHWLEEVMLRLTQRPGESAAEEYAIAATTAHYLEQTGVVNLEDVRGAMISGWEKVVLKQVSIMDDPGGKGSDPKLRLD